MIWGILIDLIVIIFIFVMMWKGIKKLWAKLAILAILIPTLAMATEWVEVPHGEDYCPYGDAVMVSRENPDDATPVACILYDRKKEAWDTWIENAKGDRLFQNWPISEYRAYTMDGELTVKDDKVILIEEGREISDEELHSVLSNIFSQKGVN